MSELTALPYVSVIVPIYNNPEGVKAVVTALMRQTYPADAYEVILADNGSSDETFKVISDCQTQFPKQVRSVVENAIQSSYAARNQGLRNAQGEICAFTDVDCLPAPHWLEAAVTALLRQHATCGGGQIQFSYQSKRPNVYEYYDSATRLNQKIYIDCGFAATANFFAYRYLFEQYGYFRDDLISGGDYEFGRRLTKAGEKLIYVPDAVVHHPARSSLRALYRKERRVLLGQKNLEQLGLLDHEAFTWDWLKPTRSYPYHPQWFKFLLKSERIHLILLHNLFRWLKFFTRLQLEPLKR